MSGHYGEVMIYLIIVGVALLAHEPWRWLGVALGRNLSEDDAIFLWVRAVSTALVAGLVARLVVFPAGALETVPLWVRLVSIGGAAAGYFVFRRSLGFGVVVGCGLLIALSGVNAGWPPQ